MYPVKLLDKASKVEVSQCLDLLSTSFKRSLDYFHWKHNLNEDFEIEEYTFCIFKDNLCIATLQVVIHQMIISNKSYRFALLSDGATHNDYRRLGLFEKLLSHVNEFCAVRDVSFIYGTGNDKSRKAFYKLGFKDFFTSMKASKRVRYNHPMMKAYNLVLNSFGRLTVKKNSNIKKISIKEYAAFSYSQKNKNAVIFEKTEYYLNWRLAETTGSYKIFGIFDTQNALQAVLVLKISKGLFYIVDAIYNEGVEYLNQLLKYTSGLAILNKDISKINCSHNNFLDSKEVFESNKFKISKANSSTLLYVLNKDFIIPDSELNTMHYMRIDKNE